MNRKTDQIHQDFVKVLAKGLHVKYNRIAETSLFIEIYQLGKTGNKSYQKWAINDECKVVFMGNEKIIYVFDSITLKQMAANYNIVSNKKKTGFGFVLSADEAKKRSKYWYLV